MTSATLAVPQGHVLIREGVATDRLYILRTGSFEVVRSGVRVIVIREPGAFMGEISALLGSPPMADVIALEASEVTMIDGAAAATRTDPALTHAIAQLLARRLQAVTSYLVDLKRQYAGTDTHLALMDEVLASLMAMQQQGPAMPAGSERADVPDY